MQIIFPLLLLLYMPWYAGAEEVVSLQALVDEAVKHNPEILQAQQMWEMAKAKAPQVKALPDPMLQLELQNIGLTDYTVGEMDMSMAGVSLSQPIPYPGKRRLRQQVADKEAEAAGEMVEVTRRSVVSRLKVAYSDLAFVHQSLKVVAQTRGILQEFEQAARARYGVGEGMQQDVFKAQLEVSMLIQRTQALEQQREGIRAMLNSLLDRPPDALLGTPEDLGEPLPLRSLEELNRLAREHNPELRNRQRAVEGGELQVALMQKEYRPDFAVSAGWRSRGGFDDLYQVMVEVELPWQRERRHYGVQEALAAHAAVQKGRRAVETMALAQVRDFYSMATTAGRLVALYQTTILPQTSFALESAVAGYRVGQVDFLMLLDNTRILLENQLMVQEQLADYHRAVARLEEVVGTSAIE